MRTLPLFCLLVICCSVNTPSAGPFVVATVLANDNGNDDNKYNTDNSDHQQTSEEYEFQADDVASATINVIGNPHENITTQKQKQSIRCDHLSCVPRSNLQKKLLSYHHIIRQTNMTTQKGTLQNITFVKFSSSDVNGDISASSSSGSSLEEEKGEEEKEGNDELIPIYYFKQSSQISSEPLPFQLILVDNIIDSEDLIHEVPTNIYISSQDTWFPGYFWKPIVLCSCNSDRSGSDGDVGSYYIHIGWKFTSITNSNVFFYALIVHIATNPANNNGGQVYIGNITAPNWMVHEIVGNVM